MWRKNENLFTYMKKPRIKYLELEEGLYIENDKVKVRLNENNAQERCTWDELWNRVRAAMMKVKEYEDNNS